MLRATTPTVPPPLFGVMAQDVTAASRLRRTLQTRCGAVAPTNAFLLRPYRNVKHWAPLGSSWAPGLSEGGAACSHFPLRNTCALRNGCKSSKTWVVAEAWPWAQEPLQSYGQPAHFCSRGKSPRGSASCCEIAFESRATKPGTPCGRCGHNGS